MRAFLVATAIIGVVSAAASIGLTQGKPAPNGSMKGVWQGTTSVRTGADPMSNMNRQPNILIYTDTHYCQVAQDGGPAALPPRKPLAPPKDPNKLTDAEKLARYEQWAPLGVQCGRYTVKGNTYVHHPIIQKAPPEKGTTYPDQNPVEFRVEGNTLVQFVKTADGKSENRRTYTRLE
jgi:hypothetical protein